MPLIYGLIGAVIGAAASIGTIWIQQIHQNRRDRAKLIVEAAIRDKTSADETARFLAKENPGKQILIKDLSYYIVLHSGLMDIIEKPKKIRESEWIEAYKLAKQLNDATAEHEKSYRAQQKN